MIAAALVAVQLPALQQPAEVARPDGMATPSALVQAAEGAKAQQATKERIAALTREADVLRRQSASVLDELRRLDVERELQRARELDARQARALMERDLTALTARQSALQATLDRERPTVAARLQRLQRLGRVGYSRIVWNASSAREMGRAARLMSFLSRDDGRRLAAYKQTGDALAETRTQLARRQQEARALESEARKRRAAAEAAYARKQELLATLDQETGQRERWLAELVAARTKIDAAMAMGAPAASPGVTRPAMPVPLVARRGQLPWPVDGDVAQRFGRQREARFGTSTLHQGITVATGSGAPVRSLHGGMVAFAGPFSGFGQLVIVDHGQQAYSLYGYLSIVRVQRGTAVDAGTMLGDVGDAPDGKPGLYLEVRVDGRPVDPVLWLKRQSPAP